MLGIGGGMRSTSTMALEIILGIESLDQHVEALAARNALLYSIGHFK